MERNNKKIVFLNPPLSLNKRYGQLGQAGGSEPPLGLCYLASVVRNEGFEVSIIDAQASRLSFNETAKLIISLNPSYVGITASTMAIASALELARIIKGFNSNIKIIIGGCHISALPEETFQECESFDVGVLGEGEATIIELLLALENDTDLKTVQGIAIRKEGNIYFSEPRPRIRNLDNLPCPAFDLLPEISKSYRLPAQSLTGSRSFSLVTSRGCPGRCSFCDKRVFGNYISMHSAEYIIEMICILNKKYKINNIMFEDDNFMISKERLQSLVNLINKMQLKIRWTALARVDSIDRELLEIAKSGGCWQVSYGIESGCQRILDFYHKEITINKIKDVIELTKKVGLKSKCFFIWGNPTENNNSIRETVNFIKKLDIDDISITFFTPYPGAKIWPDIKSYGDFNKNWQKMSCFELVFKPHGLEKEYLNNARKQVLKDFYFRPKTILSYLTRIRSIIQLKELILSARCLFDYTLKENKEISKYLIVNADDFGLTKGINEGIIEAFREGVVRSASIMVVGQAYDDAVRLAKENPGFDIGIHLCLTEERPVSAKNEILTLVDKDGYFLKTPSAFILNYLLGRIRITEIQKELDAQIRKVLNSGIRITHLDSHGYIHMLPSILKVVIGLARKYGILFIRYPNERLIDFNSNSNLPRFFICYVLKALCLMSKQVLKNKGILKTEHFYGFLNSGHLSEQNLMRMFRVIDNGVTEIVCHPGRCDEETKRYKHWKYAWEVEIKALSSPGIKKMIDELGLELISFKYIQDS